MKPAGHAWRHGGMAAWRHGGMAAGGWLRLRHELQLARLLYHLATVWLATDGSGNHCWALRAEQGTGRPAA